MGEPIDPIVDPITGAGCGWWNHAGDTPKYIYVYFWGLVKCPDEVNPVPNLHLFKLTQVDGSPCAWQYRGTDFPFDIDYTYDISGQAILQMWDLQADTFFIDFDPWPIHEHHIFTNDLAACPDGHGGASGFATVLWKQAAVDLITNFALPADSEILFEFFMKDDTFPVYKFCFPKYSMNVKFLVSP